MISKELIEIMENHEMSPFELSQAIGVSRQAVNNWIMERRSIPELAARILRMFDNDIETMELFESFASVKPTSLR